MPYSGNPANSPADEVWFLVGDTNSADQQLADAEVAYLLAQNSTTLGAAIEAARALEARYSGYADSRAIGDLKVTYAKLASRYGALKVELIQLASGVGSGANPTRMVPAPYAGGQSLADKDTDAQDADSVRPFFRRGMDDAYVNGDPSSDGESLVSDPD